jgi:chromosome partitioning protein
MALDKWKREEKKKDIFALKKAINNIKNEYNFILIDTPPALDVSLEIALYASNYYLIPFQAKPFCLDGIANILDEIENIKRKDDTGFFQPDFLGIFINMYEKSNTLSNSITEYIYTNDYKVLESKISKKTAVEQAQAKKESIFDFEESNSICYDYFKLVYEILNNISNKNRIRYEKI